MKRGAVWYGVPILGDQNIEKILRTNSSLGVYNDGCIEYVGCNLSVRIVSNSRCSLLIWLRIKKVHPHNSCGKEFVGYISRKVTSPITVDPDFIRFSIFYRSF